MKLFRHRVIEEYATNQGGTVVLAFYYPTKTVNVVAVDSNGQQNFSGTYNSRAGAMLAIGRRFGKVHFARMYNRKGW